MSSNPLKLMAVLAHPDDETLGVGGTLARYAAEGVEVHLVTATRGERGWFGPEDENPGIEALGKRREQELCAAARTLGIEQVSFLDYIDGDLDKADPAEVVSKIAGHLRRVRPQVVLTFGPDGAYGHPDHIAISQHTSTAIVCAADAGYSEPGGHPPHRVSKAYFRVWTGAALEAYASIFGDIAMAVNGEERRPIAWPDWMITARLDVTAFADTVWNAVFCHRSQLPGYEALVKVSKEQVGILWRTEEYYRACGTAGDCREIESDLFEGLR